MKKTGFKKIAGRYVKALLAVAEESGARDAVEKDLSTMAEAVQTSDVFAGLLANPLLSGGQMAGLMAKLCDAIGVHEVTAKFITVLAHRKRLPLLPDIAVQYAEAVAAARGEMNAQLITATPLSLKNIQVISEGLSKAYGKAVSLEAVEDPSLLGGAVLRVGSKQLDSSLAGKLKRLEQTLKVA